MIKHIFLILLILFTSRTIAGVTNGQAVNATVTNAAFMDKNTTTTFTTAIADIRGGIETSTASDSSSTGSLQNITLLAPITTFTNASLTSIENLTLANRADASLITIRNKTGGTLTIKHLTGGTSANQIDAGGVDILLADDTSLNLYYNTVSTKWQVITAGGADVSASKIASGTLAVARGGTGLASGTSGGILGYTASGTLASSAALTQYLLLIGGGAGATPTTVAAIGSSGQLLTSNGAGVAPTFQSFSGGGNATSFAGEMYNVGVSATNPNSVCGTCAETIRLKQSDGATDPSTGANSVRVGISNGSGGYNERSVTSALFLVLTRFTALGQVNAFVRSNYWVYLIDTDGLGTMAIGVSSVLWDETQQQAIVSESSNATATNASPCVFTVSNNGLSNGDAVILSGTAPTGFSTSTQYFVVASSTNTFELSATPGGSAINSSSTGSSIVVHYDGYKIASTANTAVAYAYVKLIGRFDNSFSAGIGSWQDGSQTVSVQQTMPTREDISARYFASGTSISGSLATIAWSTLDKDLHSMAPNKTTFIVPEAGRYQINSCLNLTFTSSATNTAMDIQILVNGTEVSESQVKTAILDTTQGMCISDALSLNYLDLVTLKASAGQTGPSITSSNYLNYFSIAKVGP